MKDQKTVIKILFVWFLGAIISLFVLTGITLSKNVQAQEPVETGKVTANINLVTSTFQIIKRASATSVKSGSKITYTITITNTGPDVSGVATFFDDYPAQMRNVKYLFSRAAISNTEVKPRWSLINVLVSETIRVTITGILTSAPSVTVTNTAFITDFSTLKGAKAAVNVGIIGSTASLPKIYLPIIIKSPPPPTPTPGPTTVLAYNEDFSDSNAWPEFTGSGCERTDNRDGLYWVSANPQNQCLPPARNANKPETPYRTYGEFQVDVYHSEGASEAWYGIFINGSGASEYYVFRIQPNEADCGNTGGDWELRRRKNNSETILRSGACHPSIKRGYGGGNTNTIKISHAADRNLSVFVNGTLLAIYQEEATSNHLTGTGVGVYVLADNVYVLMKFDNFKVFKF